VPSYVVTAADRAWFARCRRAWDLGALGRQALEPAAPASTDPPRPNALRSDTVGPDQLQPAVRAALAVHYYPGMWSWNRVIVAPLVRQAYLRAGGARDGRSLLAAFQRWSPTADRFTPLRVEADIDVPVPHPTRSGADLATRSGDRVRYRDRIPLVLVDGDERVWLASHRVVEEFAPPDELALDERLVTACWAWEQLELNTTVVGVYHTELRLDGEVRRTLQVHTITEKATAARRLGRAVVAMLDRTVSVDPTAAWAHCAECSFRAPCLAMNRGEDARALLTAGYRRRETDRLEEGRLGGTSWGMGRGAAPPHLGQPDDSA
jgi:hypothetical protein